MSNFFKQYHAEGTTELVKDHFLIGLHYFKGLFLVDFIALIPFHLIPLEKESHHQKFFFLVKVVRIYTGFKIFNVKQMMDIIKEWN